MKVLQTPPQKKWPSSLYKELAEEIARVLGYDQTKYTDDNVIKVFIEIQGKFIAASSMKTSLQYVGVLNALKKYIFQVQKPVPKELPKPPKVKPSSLLNVDRIEILEKNQTSLTKTLQDLTTQMKRFQEGGVGKIVQDENSVLLDKLLKRINALSELNGQLVEQKTLYAKSTNIIEELSNKIDLQQKMIDGQDKTVRSLVAELKEQKKEFTDLQESVKNLFQELGYGTSHPVIELMEEPVKEEIKPTLTVDVPKPQMVIHRESPIPKSLSHQLKDIAKLIPPQPDPLPKIPIVLVGFQSNGEQTLMREYGEVFDFTVVSNRRTSKQMVDLITGKTVLVLSGGCSLDVNRLIRQSAQDAIIIPQNQGMASVKLKLTELMHQQEKTARYVNK